MFTYRTLLRLDAVGGLLRAAALARLAERMLALVLVLYALAQFESAPLAGWVAFAATAPGLAAGPVAGALLDRLGPPSAIGFDMACSAGCILALGLLALAGMDSPALLITLAATYSLTSPLSAAGIRTLLPRLVPDAALSHANAMDASLYALVEVAGPALGGALFGFTGAAPALLTIALLYAAAGAALPRMRQPPASQWPGLRRLRQEAAAGVGYLLHHRVLRRLAGAYALYQVAWGILLVAVPLAVSTAIGRKTAADTAVGILWAVAGAAGAVGALLAGHRLRAVPARRVMAFGMAAMAVAIGPFCGGLGLPGLAAGLALAGFLSGPIDVAVLTLRQRRTEPAWLGRVMAVSMSFNLSGLPVGAAAGGLLAAWWLPGAFGAAALACVAGALASLRLGPG